VLRVNTPLCHCAKIVISRIREKSLVSGVKAAHKNKTNAQCGGLVSFDGLLDLGGAELVHQEGRHLRKVLNASGHLPHLNGRANEYFRGFTKQTFWSVHS
jgi:hypothetical protein